MSAEWADTQWEVPDSDETPAPELATIEPVAMTDWREDARFVGAFIRGGNWEIGLRIARRVRPGAGQGTSSKSGQSDRISLRDFAAMARVSTTTISTYLKVWEIAADDGRVEHAADLGPDAEYFWDAEGLHADDWTRYYRQASAPKPEPKPEPQPVKPEPKPIPEPVESEPEPLDRDKLLPPPTYVEDEPNVESRFLSAMSWVTDASITLKNSAALVLHIDLSDEQRQRYIERLARLKSQVDLLYASIDGMGFDAGIASILSEGN
jgi:hypothetical protein